ESVGLACGLFVTALHNMGLATLPHTPSPMAFLTKLLGRPKNERPFVLFPVGYPTPDAQVPVLERKPLRDVMISVPDPSGSSGR
ncbi:MAG: nitroreductase family protein, partial [Acidimicrobiia bacterium]|nr:nitroreductase family protein [Acidimicrobiia bacterium]